MTLDDRLLQGRILVEFRGILQIWEPTTAKRMSATELYKALKCTL